ncbi:alpha,alpha-trehalase TreA [Sphingomonas sp. RP10(2022)]|uniref:Alpha,alpha-trehalase TreA n=1 Tax=Sphingomonas liriopis TaxID=2949094 RepID=A0A9X2KSE1_9SPHN|nr:alpha,alpha-trehalase TreA [Sphingomonas liriopis]MCP3733693.1 alpha,alpha-trehalase TreA [Sphingomonas liriopis]
MIRAIILALAGLLVAATPLSPAQRFGPLFRDVQMGGIFPDSKTFADAEPRRDDAAILAAYRRCDCKDDTALKAFVLANFTLPVTPAAPPPSRKLTLPAHIDALWPQLTRTLPSVPAGSSALSLPRRFVVPGGRFREMYYWDSWFTMLGLQVSGRQDLVEDMIVDFGSLIDRYGRIPNGTRSYYLSRSQPPFLYLIAGLSRDPKTLAQRTRWLRAEHDFWMAGAADLRPGGEHARVVRLADGSLLNRYWDDRDDPRDESYREDARLVAATPGRDARAMYRDLRAGAESGWDFSSRWLGDGRTLATIRTTRIVPVDLNSLIYGLERSIADACRALRDTACTSHYATAADARAKAIATHLWNPAGYYADYDLDARKVADGRTAAMAFPLFAGLAAPERAASTAKALEALVGDGGLRTTLVDTGQQWDDPNGWAPLQWIAVQGLKRYREDAFARRIATRWLATVTREYDASGKLLEKYNVVARLPGGGGEYPLQDGFGWTNGVTRALLAQGFTADGGRHNIRHGRRRH